MDMNVAIKVLSVFAQHIQKIVGDKGLVARMGGEEFAVAVPSVNPVDTRSGATKTPATGQDSRTWSG